MTDLIYKEGKLFRYGRELTATNSSGYKHMTYGNKTVMQHRVIWELHHGPIPEGTQVDHINGDRLDNRIENLRLVTQSQNQSNRKINSSNTSGVKGVWWNAQCNKWQVSIQVRGERKHLGLYEDLELAELVANEAREKYHGEYARNF